MVDKQNKNDGMAAYRKDKESDIWLGGQGARLTQHQKKRIREFCLKRDGQKCMLCGREEKDLSKLQIDHINGKSNIHLASNLQLAHQSCNSRAYHSNKFNKGGTLSSHTQREKGGTASHEHQAIAPASYEVKLNKEYEPFFRRKCFEIVKAFWAREEPLDQKPLRVMARELTGCGLGASYSYIERLFAPLFGPLKYEPDAIDGAWFVGFRDPKDLNLSIEDLEAKYPKSGKRFTKDVDNK